VIFHNRFFSPREMAALVGSADIYIAPYCHEAQAVSGTLAYAMGAGKAIISTPLPPIRLTSETSDFRSPYRYVTKVTQFDSSRTSIGPCWIRSWLPIFDTDPGVSSTQQPTEVTR
jgi:hypothetical protein